VTSAAGEYAGRRVLLAGQGSRLLPVLAAELQTHGAQVMIADARSPEDLTTPVGVLVTAEIARPVAAAIDAFGSLDVLVCHSGPGALGTALELSARTWRGSVDALVGGAFELSQAAARAMVGDSSGVIVHLIGPDSVHAYPARTVAATASAAMIGLIRGLAVEFAALGIRVVGVIHGPIDGGPVGTAGLTSGDRADLTILRAPNGRLATAADIAAAIRFVAGPRATFMTGQAFRVDGGWASLNAAPLGMRFQ